MFEKIRFIYRAWKYKNRYESDEINFLLSHVRPGSIVVDIGCYKGTFLYWFRKAVGKQGKVFAFEPQPSLAQYLKKMVAKLGYKNVAVEWLGMSSQQGKLPLYFGNTTGEPSTGATLEKRILDEHDQYQVEVDVDTLDNYFMDAARRPVSFIKCDVEGHELDVFEGGKQLLKEDMPIILFECEARHLHGRSMKEIFSFLEAFGYNGYFLNNGKLAPLSAFDEQIHQKDMDGRLDLRKDYCNNFVFMKE